VRLTAGFCGCESGDSMIVQKATRLIGEHDWSW